MKYIEMRLFVRPEYEVDIEEVAQTIADAMINNSEEGDDPIKHVDFTIQEGEFIN